jgi:hypothetical protein
MSGGAAARSRTRIAGGDRLRVLSVFDPDCPNLNLPVS